MSGNEKPERSRLLRADGMAADAEVFTVKLHDVEIPLPSGKSEDLAKLCFVPVQVQDPITGHISTVPQMAMSAPAALLLLETHHALARRDKKIEALEERLAELERRFEDPAEHARGEGYDGVG